MPDDISFVWPATGTIQLTSLPGGGCDVKFTFRDRGTVRSIGKGQITRISNVPTKRIAQQYEIIVRHGDTFESSYNIIDQTPHLRASESGLLKMPGASVENGDDLYVVRDGGTLHFRLYRAGQLVDPRTYISSELT